ncbi:D-aminoacyl-tRNA deacylase (EC [Olavius algarvensis associated proteobacterium Delta 3]|nr:D-aminoacyl-tRNA deacylase (EC [Olavius algarvensis associated proteobacterium Delta 3]
MKAVVQRVTESSVCVGDKRVGHIGPGLVVLLGVGQDDGPADADWLADKICHLRIFEDEAGKMNRSLLDSGGEMLIVSQFTLYGDCRKGRRPSFTRAGDPDTARELYEYFVRKVRAYRIRTQTGRFRAEMAVHIVNHGPVTLILETP